MHRLLCIDVTSILCDLHTIATLVHHAEAAATATTANALATQCKSGKLNKHYVQHLLAARLKEKAVAETEAMELSHELLLLQSEWSGSG